ncbi:HVA22-like protein putative [Babesia bigemina]|uniref:HVA22-like protein putative n=1 Tax=Babesia bigemina TaxID=5866 RepID=A0A061CZJ1_BABBI|nr:HVA22-like protein putative [Babesia bigemina]CDR93803.1 HVA22-like protein putative [Babesia bigemina]|eukprot:XP_012765989.1 HVA22-like protein putative [Babesia bigemina]
MENEVENNLSSPREAPKFWDCFQDGAVDWIKLTRYFDYQAEAFPLMTSISRVVKLSPGIILIISIVALLIIFACGKGTTIICDAAGLLYPGYKTYKVIKLFDGCPAIRRAATQELNGAIGIDGSTPQEQLMFWAKYWVVYSLAFVFKYMLYAVFFWVPFQDLFKLCFVVMMFHPKLRGAELVFNFFVFPFLIQYEKRIDGALDFVDKKMDELMKNYSHYAMNPKLKERMAQGAATWKAATQGK